MKYPKGIRPYTRNHNIPLIIHLSRTGNQGVRINYYLDITAGIVYNYGMQTLA